jgi:hypothetical protein
MQMKQTTNKVLMIAPTNFGFNEEAFLTNSFQNRPTEDEIDSIQSLARSEFDALVNQLRAREVDVCVFEDLPDSETPDSIFPNNWISMHQTGELITYPMAVSNRRAERRDDIINHFIEKYNYSRHDLSGVEHRNVPAYLEGTGSMIFDHHNKLIYAAISPRTSLEILKEVAAILGYTAIPFQSFGKTGELIYHTNVLMSVGDKFVVIGTGTIASEDRERVVKSIECSGKRCIEITNEQVYNHFAGNMIQLQNAKGETILVLSESTVQSLTEEQLNLFKAHNDHLLIGSIPTIEKIGGGSVRCMIAEIFVPA